MGRINSRAPQYSSRVLGGFGLAILENPQAGQAVAVRTGIGVGHSHQDTLNLDITALGCRLAADLGGREEGHNRGWPNMRANRSHNLVEVDGHDFMNTPAGGSVTSGTGWTRWMVPSPQCDVMTNAGYAASHPNVSLYERTTAMVDGPFDPEAQPLYVFDVFRVAGGKQHTFCFHGAESDEFIVNTPLQPATGDAANYLSAHKEGTRQQGVVPDVLEADWRLKTDDQQFWLGSLDEARRRHSRLSLLGEAGDALMIGNAHSDVYRYDFPFLYIQKKQEKEGLESAFVSIVECYAGAPFIASKKRLALIPDDSDARAGVGAAVVTTTGRRDVLFASGHPEKTYTAEGLAQFQGEFGFGSSDAEGLRQLQLVGGKRIKVGTASIETATANYTGKITAVDYDHKKFTVNTSIPAASLAGEVAVVGNPRHCISFNLKSAVNTGGATIVECIETPKFYQSNILAVDEKNKGVVPEVEPAAIRCDPKFYDGATIADARHHIFWKAHVASDGLWMNIGHPGYRTSVLNTMSRKDLPDAASAGGPTLRMMDTSVNPEKEFARLQVTRVDEKQGTFFFKTPNNPKLQTGGWNYDGYTLRNSNNTKAWRSFYAGVSYRFVLDGPAAITPAAFTQPDGARKLQVFHYGPGDEMTLPTHVNLRRLASGEYEIRTNVACTITLPAAGPLEQQTASGKWTALTSKASDATHIFQITSEMLTGKPLCIRVKPSYGSPIPMTQESLHKQ
jgi:hypothetical protein